MSSDLSLNFEITIAVADRDFAAQVEQMLRNDFQQSREVSANEYHQRPFWFRLLARTSRLMAPTPIMEAAVQWVVLTGIPK